jgi:hypothetical protein
MTKLPPKIRIGQLVTVDGWTGTPMEVISVDDPALVVLKTANGATVKLGRRTVRPANWGVQENRGG